MNWKVSGLAAVMALAIGAPAVDAQPAARQPAAGAPAQAAPQAPRMAEGVAAVVNDQVISTFDVRQRANLILLSSGVRPTPEIQQRARAQALRDLVDENLQLQATKEFDITVTTEEINSRLVEIARSNQQTPEQLVRTLQQAGVGPGTLRQQIEADTAWNRLMSGLYRTRVRISPAEVRDTQARIAASATRAQFLVSEILLPAESEAEFTEMQAGAQRLLEQMQQGAPFPMVARQFSAAASAAAGGDMGWRSVAELPAELQSVVEQLQPGQVSRPIRGQHGIYIVALRDRRAGIPEGAATLVALRQISAPESSRAQLDRLQRRLTTCQGLEGAISGVPQAQIVDLGEPAEADLQEAMRQRIANVSVGHASPVAVADGQASTIVVCNRTIGGAGVPSADEIQNRLFEQEMGRLSERYLRNLRREATIITR